MQTRLFAAATLAAGLLTSSAASAAVLLFEDFNSEDADQLNWDGNATFFVSAGSVDLIGEGGGWDLYPGQGSYVDMDGSSGSGFDPAGEITSFASFGAGTYTVSFLLAGNGRAAPDRTTRVSLGDWSTEITLGAAEVLQPFTFTFTTTGGQLAFRELGPSNQMGNILDDVSLSAVVPEPATWAMMILGFGAAGAMIRRRAFAMA